MNIGLIGFGYWGKNIYRNLYNSDSIKKIFIFDIDKKNFKENKKANFYINSDKFFNERDIDSFIIATPTSTHLKYIKKYLNLQKKVCITKPITKTYSELLDLKRNFNNCCNIFLDHTYLYHPTINFIKNLLLKKKLGKLIYYDSERINFGKFYKDVDVVEDLAVHDVYILDYLLNGKLPNKIITTSHKNFGNKKFLSNITLKYKNGFFANIKVSWFSPLKSRRILLAGKNKMLEFDDNEIDKKLKIYDKEFCGIKIK